MIVSVTRVESRNLFSDYFSDLKNTIGGRLKAYEKATQKAIEGASAEFHTTYPTAKNIRLQVSGFSNESILVVIYGEINE